MGMGLSLGLRLQGHAAAASVPVDPYVRQNFATNGSTSANYPGATGQAAVYDASTNKTWSAWEGWDINTLVRKVYAAVYDHATGLWSDQYVVGTVTMTNDDHGVPCIVKMPSGRWAVFYGAHNLPMQWSITTNIGDVTAWTAQTQFAVAEGSSYPHAYVVGSTLHLFSREGTSFLYRLRRYAITFDGSDVPTVAAGVIVGQFESTQGRWYQGNGIVRGTDIHMVWAQADGADTWRRHVHYGVYQTATDTWNTYGGARSDAVPLAEATIVANYRLFTHTLPNYGSIPQLAFDAVNDLPFITFQDSANGRDAYYIRYTGSAWSSPVSIATIADRYNTPSPVVYPSGAIRFWYARDTQAIGWGFGGDLCYRERAADGTLGSEVIFRLASGLALYPPNVVRNAHANLRITLFETTGNPSAPEQCRMWAHGDNGYVGWQRTRGDTEAAAFLARLTTQPTAAVATALADYFQGQINSGSYFQNIVLRWTNWASSQADMLRNMTSTSFTATLTNMTWTAKSGVQGSGTGSYMSLVFNPTTGDTLRWNITKGVGGFGYWSETAGQDGGIDMGAASTISQARTASDQAALRINQSAAATLVANTDGSGSFVTISRAAGDKRMYHNGVQIASNTTAADALDNVEMRLGNRTSTSLPTTRVYAMARIHGPLTPQQVASDYIADAAFRAVLRA
jgi:hypothetical protein